MKDLDYYLNLPSNETTATHLSLIEPGIGGGRISAARIDQIADYPTATEISIGGLTQPAFERFVQRFGRQFRAIVFWKCPAVADLSPLESLPDIEYIVYFWNQKAMRLRNMARNTRLVGFAYDDFTRMHSLEDVATAPSLRELQFGYSRLDCATIEKHVRKFEALVQTFRENPALSPSAAGGMR